MQDFQSLADLDFLLESILEEKCVLFLGPQAFADDQGRAIYDSMPKAIGVENNPYVKAFYPDEGFFEFKGSMGRTRVSMQIKRYLRESYSQSLDKRTLGLLAEIPFHLVLGVTPDDFLRQVFQERGLGFGHLHYEMGAQNEKKIEYSGSHPLIYNIFGAIDDAESLVLSHDDLFRYLQGILGSNGLPLQIRGELKDARYLIFLGFDFGKWYMQILLRLLNLHDEKFAFVRYATSGGVAPAVHSLCVSQFQIEFVRDDVASIVKLLHERLDKLGRLRKPQDGVLARAALESANASLVAAVRERLQRLASLLSDYQTKKILSDDPKERMECDLQIQSIQADIKSAKQELANLQSL